MKQLVKTDIADNEPLLEYAVKVANNFCKQDIIISTSKGRYPDSIIEQFSYHYFKGLLDTSQLGRYENAKEVQETLSAFGIDTDKFWYLCLFVKDYSEGQTKGAYTKLPTPKEELLALIKEMDKMNPEPEDFSTLKFSNNGSLTFKVDNSKHPVRITNNETLYLINEALKQLLIDYPKKDDGWVSLDNEPLGEKVTLPVIYTIYYFHKFLSWFLKDYKAKAYADSKDKMLLISRMVYIMGISDDSRYYEKNLNFLKNNLRRYKDIVESTENSRFI